MAKLPVDGDVGGATDTAVSNDSGQEARVALETTIAEKLAVFNNDEPVGSEEEIVDDDTEPVGQDDSTDDVEDDSQDDSDDVDDESQEDDSDSGEAEVAGEAEAEPTGDVPVLSQAMRRSLEAYDFTEEEIDANLKNMGGKFVEIAAGLHTKRQAELTQWATIGQRAREANQQTGQEQHGLGSDQPSAVANVNGIPVPSPIDAAKLKEEFGDEPIIDKMIGPVNAVIAALNAVIPRVEMGIESVRKSEMSAANARLNQFFEGDQIAPFRKFYGGSDKELTPEQIEHRSQVLDTADLLIGGARESHRELSLEAALLAAHDTVSAGFKEQATRRSLKKAVKKRNRGITQRPSRKTGAGASEPQDGNLSRAQLEKRTAERLAKVFT